MLYHHLPVSLVFCSDSIYTTPILETPLSPCEYFFSISPLNYVEHGYPGYPLIKILKKFVKRISNYFSHVAVSYGITTFEYKVKKKKNHSRDSNVL